MSRIHGSLALLACITGSVACRAEISTTPPGKVAFADETEVAWTEMNRRLEGRWQAVTPSMKSIRTSYRSVSKGSALVETFTSASGKETLTVYHRDGHGLMLTHYCAQGNQARLRATEATRDRIVFSFVDATNVSEGQDVMRRLAFVFRPDGFDQESVYRQTNGEEETTTLHFTREAPKPHEDDGGESH